MATELNVELTVGLGFSIPDGAGPNDLLVAVRGDGDATIRAGLDALDAAMAAAAAPAQSTGFGDAPAPRSVRAAAQAAPDSAVVVLSVPGSAVIGEAMDAIEAGRHVMIFSDNVPVEHEVALKEAADRAGVIVMGPDCGTAVIGGVGLGFANVLAGSTSGPTVGVIAASGTGAQQLTSLLDEAGVPISQVIGVGGRDLSEPVAARSTLAALRLLEGDPNTDHIVIISKPPHLAVAKKVQDAASTVSTPTMPVLLGKGRPNITEAVEAVLGALEVPVPEWPSWLPESVRGNDSGSDVGGALRGLFSGGTLADEAMLVIGDVLQTPIRSNIPLSPELALPEAALGHGVPHLSGLGTVVVDLGDDEFTKGRPHPMIDPSVKLDLLAAQASDPDVRVILLDVVLGYCAEPDPSALLAPVITAALDTAAAAGRPLDVVVSLCGTAGDPQDRERQAAALVAAGAQVHASNAAAARAAAAIADPSLQTRSIAPLSGKDA
jgi:FdrA protein